MKIDGDIRDNYNRAYQCLSYNQTGDGLLGSFNWNMMGPGATYCPWEPQVCLWDHGRFATHQLRFIVFECHLGLRLCDPGSPDGRRGFQAMTRTAILCKIKSWTCSTLFLEMPKHQELNLNVYIYIYMCVFLFFFMQCKGTHKSFYM